MHDDAQHGPLAGFTVGVTAARRAVPPATPRTSDYITGRYG